MRAVLVVVGVGALLVFSSYASAGPPSGECRHISKAQCERDLGPYSAARFLEAYVIEKVRPRLTATFGNKLYCDYTKQRRPWVFRCGETIEQGGLPSPCTVEAIVARDKRKVFHFDWLKESVSCTA